MTGSRASSPPIPNPTAKKKNRLPSATDASACAETWPTMIVSTVPIAMSPTCTITIGSARVDISRTSVCVGTSTRNFTSASPDHLLSDLSSPVAASYRQDAGGTVRIHRGSEIMQEHHISVSRSARYYTLGPTGGSVTQVWIVCHGFAQLAGRFIRHFEPLDDGTRLIVAPEALNRFYVEAKPGFHGPDSKVGATWMTREDRLREIEDYVGYLDTLADAIFARIDRASVRLTILGFSQGVATVVRWAIQGHVRPDQLIMWASPLPPEIMTPSGISPLARIPRLSVVVGTLDANALNVLPKERERMDRLGLTYDFHSFEGGHHLDEQTLRTLASTPI
jgi:predicted esterase